MAMMENSISGPALAVTTAVQKKIQPVQVFENVVWQPDGNQCFPKEIKFGAAAVSTSSAEFISILRKSAGLEKGAVGR